jgi:hypothetical protein
MGRWQTTLDVRELEMDAEDAPEARRNTRSLKVVSEVCQGFVQATVLS